MLVRPAAVSGLALSAAFIAVAPTVVAPPEVAVAAPPAVHIEELHLAGIGQDIYQAITAVVQQAVGGVSYIVNFIPLIGGPIAAQININYFQGIQPIIEATVNYAAAVVQNPRAFIASTQNYGTTLYDIGYNYVSAQLQFIGLNPLPPLPPIAASSRTPNAAAGVRESAAAADGPAGTPAPAAPEADGAVELSAVPEDSVPVARPTAGSGAGVDERGAVGRRAAGPIADAGGAGQRPARAIQSDVDGAAGSGGVRVARAARGLH